MDNAVTGQTLIGEIVNNHPEAIEILLSIGMHCLGCPASQMESLEDACAVHERQDRRSVKDRRLPKAFPDFGGGCLANAKRMMAVHSDVIQPCFLYRIVP